MKVNARKYFEKNGKIYGDSYKYEFGVWSHIVTEFDSYDDAKKWLYSEEFDFRARELITKTEARKLGYDC